MNLYKLFTFILILQVTPLHTASNNQELPHLLDLFEESNTDAELRNLLQTHQGLYITKQEYQTLSQGWELSGLQDLPNFINQQIEKNSNYLTLPTIIEESCTDDADTGLSKTISDIISTNVKNTIIENFAKRRSHQCAFCNTLKSIIHDDIDLNQTPDPKKFWGANYPILNWLNDPQHDPIFEYCNKNTFMKPVIRYYIKESTPNGVNDLMKTIIENNNSLGLQFLMKQYNFNQDLLDNLLLKAVMHDADKIIPILLTLGAKADQQINANDIGANLLHTATVHRAVKSIPLLAQLIDINQPTRFGITPLHFAASHKSLNIHQSLALREEHHFAETVIPVLLQNGANVHKKDGRGQTPLCTAAYKVNDHALSLLLAAGAQVDDRDNKNQTPLHAICATDKWSIGNAPIWSIMSQLVDAGADLEALDHANKKPGDYSNLLTAVLLFKNRS